MHLVVDALAVRAGSAGIVVEHLLHGWAGLAPADRITILADGDLELTPPPSATVVQVGSPAGGRLRTAWLRSFAVRREARRLGADAVLSGVPASALVPPGCPHGLIMYDFRHELRPHQFPRSRRAARRVSWGLAMRNTDHIFCISRRTYDDLRRLHPGPARKGVVARLGADHVDAWPSTERAVPPYALTFGHFSNKNAGAVLAGWARFCASNVDMTLRVVGLGRAGRPAVEEEIARLGIGDRVELMPWLDDESFQRCFAGAGLIVFPSDFEGFGLPAAEALRLGIPLVVSADEALAEVTGGHAAVTASTGAEDLADAMARALARTPEQLAAGQAHIADFTWRATAAAVRGSLAADAR